MKLVKKKSTFKSIQNILVSALFFSYYTTNAQLLSGGTGHSVAICSDGTLSAWGLNNQNELAQGTLSGNSCTCEATAIPIPSLSGVVAVGAGGSHTLAVMSDGTVKAWGRNFDRELGDGSFNSTGCFCSLNIVDVVGLSDVKAVSASEISSFALKNDGTVWAWGGDNFGQLGDGAANLTGCYCEPTIVQTVGLSDIIAISSGSYHTLALKSDGKVYSWGNNMEGQLGDGNTTSLSTPYQLPLSDIIAIAGGQNFSYALKNDGTVWAWGDNYWGQLGNGTTTDSHTPIQVSGLNNVIAIANSFNHSIALKSDGTVYTWGGNYSGQLGNGTTDNSSIPIQVNGLSDVVALAGTMGNFCLVIKSDGTVWSWGDNFWGSVGNGSASNALSPVEVQGLCSLPVAVEPVKKNGKIKVYPNPVETGQPLTINTQTQNSTVEIFNVIGERVYNALKLNYPSNIINTILKPGIYFVKLDNKYTEKILVK